MNQIVPCEIWTCFMIQGTVWSNGQCNDFQLVFVHSVAFSCLGFNFVNACPGIPCNNLLCELERSFRGRSNVTFIYWPENCSGCQRDC
jgi:hypothetical protein